MLRKSIVTIDLLENTVHPVPDIIREAAVFLFLLYSGREREQGKESENTKCQFDFRQRCYLGEDNDCLCSLLSRSL